ncbi:cell division protein ZapD [Methylobacillus gramineus]|uniref:cell division protein ZapD n=1 Tax=Methylobacillus gramineus TaxID=755169 RepID=UPI001CFF6122|nr:cell division protein ZapD [Methylobacillus gramineus]MCB5186248.1 cell division protein ZapD [Methylobacillus gramineus]
MPSYDYPFNERIRTMLRLEDLFIKVLHNIEGEHEFNHHCALLSIFQILDVIERAELKVDLLQELDRQKIVMNNLRGNPSIEEQVLNDLVNDIESAAKPLRGTPGKLGQTLRDNEWLMSIKQRSAIPGGVCEFDLPSYHYWLGLSETRRQTDLSFWLSPLMPLYDAIRIILHILRGSGATTSLTAIHGAYQQMLGGAKPAQMLRVEIHDDLPCFPEVSANKYAINIRFNSLDNAQRPRPCDSDINFSLTLCNL